MNEHAHDHEHVLPVKTFIGVWVLLLILTGVTVGVAQVDFGTLLLSSCIAVLIAGVKASLVLLFFMHLLYDQPLFRWMFLVTFITTVIFIVMTYTDTFFRYVG